MLKQHNAGKNTELKLKNNCKLDLHETYPIPC
jgi:hypothetical protein